MRVVDMEIAAARKQVDIALRRLRRHLLTAVVMRDGPACHYCGTATIETEGHPLRRTLDHVIPQKFGGTDELSNLVLACSACNSRKGAQVSRTLLCPACRGAEAH